jgi:hypothetical protein
MLADRPGRQPVFVIPSEARDLAREWLGPRLRRSLAPLGMTKT